MDCELFVELPETFSDPQYPRSDYVPLALKSLYGFKQSAYLWSNDIKDKMLNLGFIQSDADEGIFLSANKQIIVAIYVDDGLIKAEHQEEIDWVIAQLSKHYMIRSWKGGTWNELNRTKVYSISKKLSSAKVGNPLYLNSSHVVRAKPLHSSLHQKRSPSLKKNPFLCQFHFIFLNDLTINVLLFHPRVV